MHGHHVLEMVCVDRLVARSDVLGGLRACAPPCAMYVAFLAQVNSYLSPAVESANPSIGGDTGFKSAAANRRTFLSPMFLWRRIGGALLDIRAFAP